MGDLIKPVAWRWQEYDFPEDPFTFGETSPYQHEEHVNLTALYDIDPNEAASRIATLEAQLAERDAEVADLTKALTGLTCGGSEFFSRKGDRFVADIKACVEYVRRAKTDAHKGRVEAIRATKKAEAQLATAVGALERIADPRNIHFAGDAQVVAATALRSIKGGS